MKRTAYFIAPCLMAVLLAPMTGAQGPGGRAAAPAPPATSRSAAPTARAAAASVARVGDLRIGYDELDHQVQQAFRLYRDRNRVDIAPELAQPVRRQVLENLIRQRLLALEGRRRGETVSDVEADAQVRLDPAFQTNGLFNEAKYLAIRSANPDEYARVLAATKDALAARKAGERVDRETRPDDAAIRSGLEREMTRASIEYLALRRSDFDANIPEPREADVLAHYTANAERYRRPEEATLSVILFNRPAVSDSTGATDAGYRAWEQRMRGRADSAMAALRGGARFEDLGVLNGGLKKVTMRRDRPPDLWRGTAREVAAVFAAGRGTVLAEPVRTAPGWGLVRVESVAPSRIAPLSAVSREIRTELRGIARRRAEDAHLATAYAAMRDSLRGDGYRVRYALADTSSFRPAEPTAQELDRYYRGHLADYSSYDRASGQVIEVPFAQARDDVRRRLMREQRRQLARSAADRLRDVWARGRRDAALEGSMTLVRDLGVVPAVGDADTGRAGPALTAAIAARHGQSGVTVAPVDGGFLLIDLGETVRDHLPTMEQARSRLATQMEAGMASEDEAEARRMFETSPSAQRSSAIMHFSRLVIEPPATLDVQLTRDEVERYYQAHLNDFSVEEISRVRHILIPTSGRGALPDAVARARAESLLVRLRAGDDFARLAALFSDDEATRLNGGDVGVFRRGMMREAFERASFAMRPGDFAGPVRTEVGYHVLECLEYQPAIFRPLVEVYANVAFDCAGRKAKRIAIERADSLYRTLKTVAQAKAMAAKYHLEILATDHEVGRHSAFDAALRPYIMKLETLKPRVLYPGTQYYEGLGSVISWVDTIIPPRPMGWAEAREGLLAAARRERGNRAVLAKRAELDSMARAGWSFDSLATLWGGLESVREAELGGQLRNMGGRALLDSLVFGPKATPVLEVGKVTGWVEFPGGFARMRVAERLFPDPSELDRRVEQRRKVVLWRNLNAYFDRLKERYPVEIMDGDLRTTALLEPTES